MSDATRCPQCNRIPTQKKDKPHRPWRKHSLIEWRCACGNRWRVRVARSARRPGWLARVASLMRHP